MACWKYRYDHETKGSRAGAGGLHKHKHLICPERLREVPEQFSWLDHRLVSDHYLDSAATRQQRFIHSW